MCACTCLCNCRKVMTTCLFFKLWVLVWCSFCLSLPLYSVVIPVSQCLERTRLLLTLVLARRRHHMYSLAGFPSQSNVYNKVLEMRKSGLCPSVWHARAISLRLIRVSQSYSRCLANLNTLNQLLCTFYTDPSHLWSLWDCTHSRTANS